MSPSSHKNNPSERPIFLLGGGGHGAVVADLLLAQKCQFVGVVDPALTRGEHWRFGLDVLGDDSALSEKSFESVYLANGLGFLPGLNRRQSVYEYWRAKGYEFIGCRHPSAVVSINAEVAADAQLMPNTTVQCGAVIGRNCILNSAAVVEHDSVVGAHSHIAPGAIVCGGVNMSEGCFIGAGAVVVQQAQLPANTVVKAGQVYR